MMITADGVVYSGPRGKPASEEIFESLRLGVPRKKTHLTRANFLKHLISVIFGR
jgi:hypothetical protein